MEQRLETSAAAPGVNPPGAARRKDRGATWTGYLYLLPIFAFVGGLIYYTIYYTAEVSLFRLERTCTQTASSSV